MTTKETEPASTSVAPLNKIPACGEYEPCDDEEGRHDEEEGEEEEGARGRKKPCKVPKKRIRPCVRRSQLDLPGKVPEQFGGKPPCRKISKNRPKKKRCRPKQDHQGDDGADGNKCEGDEEECVCDDDGTGGDGQDGNGTGGLGGRGRGEGEDDDDEGYNDGRNTDQFGKKPCRKKKPKPPKAPCRPPPVTGGPLPKDERIFPSLPRRNLGEKPPEQKFPPAEDPDSYDKRRRAPCGAHKSKHKPCKKQHGSDSSSCSSSSSDSANAAD